MVRKYLPDKMAPRFELREIDAEKLVQLLLSAFADEMLAHYMYLMASQAVRGSPSRVLELERVFLEIAKDELEDHAMRLLKRLQHFDVDPPDFRDLWELSRCKYPELPQDRFDIDAWLVAAVKAERCAIEHYREIYDYVKGRDPVTEDLVKNILKDEVEHETIFRSLLSREGLDRVG